MFELVNLPNGVLGPGEIMLHYHPEVRPILLRFQLREGSQLVGERIVRHRHRLCQFPLPVGISYAVKLLGLAVEFLALELEKHHIRQLIFEGGGDCDGVGDVTYWS